MDETLRRLHRAAVGGDPDAAARHLLQRVRAGELSEVRLRLAAFLGHPPARRLRSVAPYGTWSLALWRFDVDAVLRAGVAAARVRLAAEEEALAKGAIDHRDSGLPQTYSVLGGVEAWILHRGRPAGEAARERALALGEARPRGPMVGLLLRLFEEADQGGPKEVKNCHVPGPVSELLEIARDTTALTLPRGLTSRDRRRRTHARVDEAVAVEMLPWALGLRDPLAERSDPGASRATGGPAADADGAPS